jgi:SAM-dependent methyltransferase
LRRFHKEGTELEKVYIGMDLKEAKGFDGSNRHPWELARVDALSRILRGPLKDGLRVRDLGCGAGFVARELFNGLEVPVTAVDSNFTASDIAALSRQSGNITYSKALEGEGRFDLVLLLDMIEHVDDDFVFLLGLVEKRLAAGGRVLITAPAFNSFFSSHDRFLGHRRRYSLGELSALTTRAGLKAISSGYLFSSLLLPRALSVMAEKAFGTGRATPEGVGSWRGGHALTMFLKTALSVDNSISMALNRALGVRLPGLTGWVLCEKQR